MTVINAIILGFAQVLTGFLPISSSAHIRIVGELLGTGADPGAAFTAITRLGTEAAVLGGTFQSAIESVLRSLQIVATTLIVFGIADPVGAKRRRVRDITVPHAAVFGFAQALALIPGVSRSGGTISASLFLGYELKTVARYSFLFAIPAVLDSGFYELVKVVTHQEGTSGPPCTP